MSTHGSDCLPPRETSRIRTPPRRASGKFAFRGVTSVAFESALERDYLVRLEFFPNVTGVLSRPVTVPFTGTDGRSHAYTPDFLVFRSDARPELVEVGPSARWRAHRGRWSPGWKAARRLARRRGWTFRLHDESRIRDRTLATVLVLQRYRRMSFPADEGERIVDAVASGRCATLGALLAAGVAGDDSRVGIAHVFHLVAHRRLDYDVRGPLDDATELKVIRRTNPPPRALPGNA